jgi:two-component system cell cycle sensor histidine kinase/response regulator CckA
VLVVDDAAEVRSFLEALLWREGFNVFLAAHGHQAIGLFSERREEVAVVLLDVQMPGVDGPKILSALQKIDAEVRCCFMTGNPKPYTEEELLRRGAIRVFRKPFALPELVGTLKLLTAQSSPSRVDRWIDISQEGA